MILGALIAVGSFAFLIGWIIFAFAVGARVERWTHSDLQGGIATWIVAMLPLVAFIGAAIGGQIVTASP